MHYYLKALKKYAVFSGRARRAEYWYFVLFNIIVAVILGLIEKLIGITPEANQSFLINIYQLAIFIPSLAVTVRRMHDVNKSGWFIFIPIYNFILTVSNGTKGGNQYGPDPKAIEIK